MAECQFRLKPDDFSNPKAWQTICSLPSLTIKTAVDALSEIGVDSTVVLDWLSAYEKADDNGKSRLEKFIDESDRAFGYRKLREVLERTHKGSISKALELSGAVQEVAEEITRRHAASEGYIGETVMSDYDGLHKMRKDAIKFGLEAVDKMMGRLNKGHFIIIAARPGGGKSAMMLYPVIEMVRNGGRAVILTLEMERMEVVERILANLSGVPTERINGRTSPTETDLDLVGQALVEMKKWKLSIIDSGLTTIRDIERLLAKAKAEGDPIRTLVIDHFGLLKPPARGKSRYEEYTEISNEIKRVAKQYQCTMIALCQLNRMKDSFECPSLEHLRDTGSLEQDADKILFLHKDKTDQYLTYVTLAKNRQGRTDDCQMKFYGDVMRFFPC